MLRWVCLFCCALLSAPASAQSNYPERPIRLVVAFPPGGATDTFIRQITNELKDALGQPVVIENRGGGGGYIAWNQVATADADGYTLLVAENAVGISQALYKKHPSGFDPVQQYDAIAAIASTPLVLSVANNLNVKSFAELVTYAKSRPEKLSYAHAGTGSVAHLVFEVIRDGAGIETLPVPYKGGGPAVADVVAGHVSAIVSAVSVAKPLIETGRIQGIAITGPARSPALPGIPTLKEIGVKHADVDLEFWWGIFGPRGIPEPVRVKIEKAFQTVMADPNVRARLAKVDINPSFAPGTALRIKLVNEITNWTKFIDEHGIKAE
jgi:tripartite-type tricarboxylate transporter receptor subunit TctC